MRDARQNLVQNLKKYNYNSLNIKIENIAIFKPSV